MSLQILPSILAADLTRLADDAARVGTGGADGLHVDVMDGHFVPNITFGLPVVSALKRATALPLDVHLMITDPDRYIDPFIEAGAATVHVHVETAPHLNRTVRRILDRGARAGVAINPATSIHALDEILPEIDVVLIMSVNPGFTGQSFLPSSIRKIEAVAERIATTASRAVIEVDGGVDTTNIAAVVGAGASIVVAGASVFHTPDPASSIRTLRELAASR